MPYSSIIDEKSIDYTKGFNAMEIVGQQVTLGEIARMAERTFGNMVKAVIDVDREILAVDGELHSDLEALLIENGSQQRNLWGINLYPEMDGDDFIEFDSMINMRPSQGNRSRGVESADVREAIVRIVAKRIAR
ncbi:MAG: DUF5674 family protein [Candidatus Krumholzibacteria bacterium]|nr:DUF5674 family protein [Candidatus Krumholzibacteria bacterium]